MNARLILARWRPQRLPPIAFICHVFPVYRRFVLESKATTASNPIGAFGTVGLVFLCGLWRLIASRICVYSRFLSAGKSECDIGPRAIPAATHSATYARPPDSYTAERLPLTRADSGLPESPARLGSYPKLLSFVRGENQPTRQSDGSPRAAYANARSAACPLGRSEGTVP